MSLSRDKSFSSNLFCFFAFSYNLMLIRILFFFLIDKPYSADSVGPGRNVFSATECTSPKAYHTASSEFKISSD